MLKVTRLTHSANETIGVYSINKKIICFSLELPWKDNQTNISCIPYGFYEIKKEQHERLGKIFRIYDVKDRSNIYIHIANTAKEIKGCLACGLGITEIGGQLAVSFSFMAMEKLYNLLPEEKTGLIIEERFL